MDTATACIECVDDNLIRARLYHIAKDPIPCRTLVYTLPGHEKCTLHETDDFIAQSLEGWGYAVLREPVQVQAYRRNWDVEGGATYAAPQPADPWYTACNVYGMVRGSTHPQELIVVISHKDSQSWMVNTAGAYDNGIGTVANLEIARVLQGYRPKRTLWFVFCNEEHAPWTSAVTAQRVKDEGYALGDLMGQAGVEATYERELRGEKGEEYQEVTATGRVVDSHRREPVRGMDARLSIDLALQQVAESAMDSIRRGALVALDPRTGEILALVSRPAFNPDIYSTVVPPEIWRELNDDVERPLFNRATMGTYPPGSTAKMVSAAAGLETGVLDSSTRLRPCTGGLAFGNRVYACWNKRGHGSLNVVHAIEASCNVFFYQVGERVGVDKWGTYARLLGLGQKTGIDLPGEDEGVVPSTQVYDRRFGKGKWGRGEALNVGIGQGIVLVTPVQMARYAAALATGYLVTPHLAIGFTDTNGVEHAPALRPPKPVSIQPDVLRLIRSAMVLVTEGGSGTAHRAAVPGFHVAGKTGTAQNPHGDDHSWFVGFAPVPNPTIAIAVICENAGHGSTRAAPVAGAVLRRHLLGPEQPRPKKDEEMTVGHPITQLRN